MKAVTKKGVEEIKALIKAREGELRARFGVKRIGIFGSYARGEASPESDVDLLVEFERPIGWEIVDLHDYLEELLGMKVDLVSKRGVERRKLLWEKIEKDLVYV